MKFKPFIKWAGGKRQLLPAIMPLVPKEFNNYFEPFLGGGAVFFALYTADKIKQDAYLTDINNSLINTYWAVKSKTDSVIGLLREYTNTKEAYAAVRVQDTRYMTVEEQAARFIYLNKTAFNGLHRVNSKGEFNTPYGNYANPLICDIETLRAASIALQKAKIFTASFEEIQPSMHDFCYLDPPYYPINKKSFVAYSKKKFGPEEQERLAQYIEKLAEKNVYVMLSNSCTDWVLERYNKFNIIKVDAKRNINSKGNARGKIKEVIITNF